MIVTVSGDTARMKTGRVYNGPVESIPLVYFRRPKFIKPNKTIPRGEWTSPTFTIYLQPDFFFKKNVSTIIYL